MKIEFLFPELSTVYGDAGNSLYIRKSIKDADIIETKLEKYIITCTNYQ